jgi:type IV pilus assembly protein PilM
VGLDIGTSGVRAAELRLGRGGATLERFGQVALPQGAVRDGEVVDVAVVADAIKQLWTQAKFSTRKVVVGVANQKVVVRQVDLPWLPLKELRQSLAFQVQDYIPMPVEHAILDVHPLEEFTNDAGARMPARAARRGLAEMVGSALQAVTQAGPQTHHGGPHVLRGAPVAGDLERRLRGGGGGPRRRRRQRHQHRRPPGRRAALRAHPAHGRWRHHRRGGRAARTVERAGGVDQAAHRTAPRPEPGEGHPANRAIESTGGAFVEEVRGSLDYYLAQPGAARIGRVVLSGGGSQAVRPGRAAHRRDPAAGRGGAPDVDARSSARPA